MAAKEERIVKMVDGSACEVISTGIIKITERDGTMRAFEAVRYVPEARYKLISIKVLDEEGCRIQVQQGVIIIRQGDRVILEGEKYGWLYKLKKKTQFRWSFRDKLGKDFIRRWTFKKDCNGT